MSVFRLAPLVPALALAACIHSAASTGPTRETPAMTPSAATQTLSPRLDAEQSLLRVLELIGGLRSIADIDMDRLASVFGLPFAERNGRFGYAEQLTPEWWSSYEWDPQRRLGAQFEFAFRPAQPETDPAAGDICSVDVERFAAELERQGFARDTYRAEYGKVIHERFQRPKLTVTVYVRGESDASAQQAAHACIMMIHIH